MEKRPGFVYLFVCFKSAVLLWRFLSRVVRRKENPCLTGREKFKGGFSGEGLIGDSEAMLENTVQQGSLERARHKQFTEEYS